MNKLVFVGVVGLVGLLVLQWLLGPVPDRRNWELFMDMGQSAAYQSQSVNPYFADGLTQRQPVAGTIARGHMPFPFGDSDPEMERAGRELINPFGSGRAADSKRGRVVYETFCQVCHGATGDGGGSVSRRGYPPAPSLLTRSASDMPDGKLFYILTRGYRNMPPYGSLIDRDDRWQAIAHLRTLQGSEPDGQPEDQP